VVGIFADVDGVMRKWCFTMAVEKAVEKCLKIAWRALERELCKSPGNSCRQ
jgi:hypothetical protein